MASADTTRCAAAAVAAGGCCSGAYAADVAEVPALVAMGISPDVGVLEVDVSLPGEWPPLKGPSLRSRACVEGDRGACRCDLRLAFCIISTAQASRSTGVRLAAWMKLSWSWCGLAKCGGEALGGALGDRQTYVEFSRGRAEVGVVAEAGLDHLIEDHRESGAFG